MTTRQFIKLLTPSSDKPLVFEHDGQHIQPGYHVTEIKSATFSSLDCGARPQNWQETIVQLWDVRDQPERGHMSVKKFLGIWRKVEAAVALDGDGEIKFEWGDATTPSVHYVFAGIRDEVEALVITLAPVRAACKPSDEWWLAQQESAVSCCAPSRDLIEVADIGSVAPAPVC
jgi:hypothetical protein